YRYLPEIDRTVITLQHQRAGRTLVAIERAAGDAGNLLAIDHHFAVECHGHFSADERDIEILPFSGTLGGVYPGLQEAIDTGDDVAIQRMTLVVFDLGLVAATQVDAAVAAFGVAKFDVELEVGEFAVGNEVVARLGITQQAVLYDPAIRLV